MYKRARSPKDGDLTFASRGRSSSEAARVFRILAIRNHFNVDFHSVSVALIDSQRVVVLLNLSLIEIDVRYAVTRAISLYGVVVRGSRLSWLRHWPSTCSLHSSFLH
jgi:hypothetical protein